jgi:hypothetical protein
MPTVEMRPYQLPALPARIVGSHSGRCPRVPDGKRRHSTTHIAVLAWARGICASALLIITLGCASNGGYPDRAVDPKTELLGLNNYFEPQTITAYATLTGNAKQLRRDEIVNGRLRAIDLNYGIFEQTLTKDVGNVNVGSDWAVLALAGAGTIVTGADTKAVLAAVSALITGAKLSVDKNIYYEKTILVILGKMTSLRRGVLVTIRKGLTHDEKEYPLEQALIDLDDYYNAGTIPGALIDVNASSGAALSQSNEKLKQISAAFLEDDAGNVLFAFWKPDGAKVDPEHDKILRKWLTDQKVTASPYFFIRGDSFADQRTQAVSDLKLKEKK